MKKISFNAFIFVIASFGFFMGCHKEVTKDENKQTKIPPSAARIEGEIIKIEPVNSEYNGPCGEYPCVASVKLVSIEYGAAFPVLTIGKEFKVKFNYTLVKTTKEMFPDLEESYPGLEVGDKFTAIVSHSLKMKSSNQPQFQISSYSKNN
jgi:hypothetical protein